MATLKQCDRCKFTGPISSMAGTISFDDDRNWELCINCFKMIEKILCDGGAQYQNVPRK